MKLTSTITITLIIPTIVLLSGCSMLSGNKADDQSLLETEIMVPEIQSTFLEGDTLWEFAERTTGSGFNWEQIKAFNEIEDEKKIDAGVVLFVPADLAIESLKNQ